MRKRGRRPSWTPLLSIGLVALLVGCFDEELPEEDLDGSIVVPGDLVDDPRSIGVVYLGIYEAFDPDQLGYPYPATAPRVGDNPIGDALPYGGTSLGDYAFACYRALQCKVVTGRYSALEDILEVLPVQNEDGEDIDAEEMFDHCSWYYGYNQLAEFQFLSDELDFEQNGDGDWEASFRAWHTRLPEGAIVWGFADNDHTSCTIDRGAVNRKRSEDGQFWREGTNFNDVLNFPDKYITEGDFISETPTIIAADQRDGYRLLLDYRFGEE